jgi:hypothetical protein
MYGSIVCDHHQSLVYLTCIKRVPNVYLYKSPLYVTFSSTATHSQAHTLGPDIAF